jgi:hypothetical protein
MVVWANNWAWGLPLVVLTAFVHAFRLVLIRDQAVIKLRGILHARRSSMVLAFIAAVMVLLLTLRHSAEATAWAGIYVAVGARPDFTSVVPYSLSTMTSYGHANIFLAEDWQLMGAKEALNGMMLFGLSTAFLFAALQAHWPARGNQ